MAEKRFLLRLDQALYDQLANVARREGRSVNAHIVQVLGTSVGKVTFEQRQIIGQTVSGTALMVDTGLVSIAGIFYRYLIDANESVDRNAVYTVIESNGNILTLKRV
ncbi:type II toxin-antitoxin system antitoxin [Furfurilactobacillus curtus]|uniref:Arc-like DNA binding domain-containing protein n=1 Tax=Furfurilactobacillus curtus TaxID=1746200 RepID=A0ABQ5JMP0_9LACO